MKLYGSYTSPFVRHCRIVLLEEQLECEFIETDFDASAQKSPTKKVPFLEDGDVQLTDSASILMYLRQKAGKAFPANAEDFNLFCEVNTVLDASVVLFFMEMRDGMQSDQSVYLSRNKARVQSALAHLDTLNYSETGFTDGELRLACLLAWGLYRNRFSLGDFPNLSSLLQRAESYQPFIETRPPKLD
jgi:glutathione S-transferase